MAPPKATIDFDWTPKGSALTFTMGGHTYPYSTQQDAVTRASDVRYGATITPVNSALTFTASAVLPTGVIAVEWRWDFGDGTIAFGPSVTHQYRVAAPHTETALRMTDSYGRTYNRSKVMNLRYLNSVMVQPVIRAVG